MRELFRRLRQISWRCLWLGALCLALFHLVPPGMAANEISAEMLPAALASAESGDSIVVRGGSYQGQLTLDRSITLIGLDWPVIDGGGSGTVVKIAAPDVTLRGFLVRGSGSSLDQENAGIAVEEPGAILQGNWLEDTLFGIYLREAHGTVIRDNQIHSKDLEVQRRGDPVRVWYSNDVVVEDNVITRGRDVVLWYSERLTVRGNTISEGRYGLHFMYCDDALIERNVLGDNSVGAFLMYSRRLQMRHNTVTGNRGPSGYGIGLKDIDDAVVARNLFLDNRIGAYLDGSPREVDSVGLFDGNVFAFNDIGVELLSAVRHNQFTGNSFVENQEQVTITGGGQPGANEWHIGDRGNYWSDYAGYDADGDGRGDLPYRSDRLFEELAGRWPALRLFLYSPATNALDFAARAFPTVRPQPKLVDRQPLLFVTIPSAPPLPSVPQAGWIGIGVAMLLLALGLSWLPRLRTKRRRLTPPPISPKDQTMIEVKQLSKRFGNLVAVDDVSFTVQAGEAVALWGANGAGKTTAVRCLLNLISFAGSITINGLDVAKEGKAVRRLIGFVPQELAFHDDLTVRETLRFYARLKKVALDEQENALLDQLALGGHIDRQVRELSGGLKQRLALAVALLSDPPLLVLDEPTANLDIRAREEFLLQLLSLKRAGKTLVFSSHRLEEVTALADRVLLLEAGKLIVDAPPRELETRLGWETTLHLYLPPKDTEPALRVLRSRGLTASPNGRGLRVQVAPGRKGETLRLLHEAGVHIEDFVVE